MEIGRWMGSLHPALIHFPIALLIVAVLCDGAALLLRDLTSARFARALLLVGMVSTLFAFVCGNFAELWAARSGIGLEAIEYHEYLATVTSWSFVGLTAWRLLMKDSTHLAWRWIWVCLGLAASVMIFVTSHFGGVLVYDHAAAIQGIPLKFAPTHDALVALNQRQDPDSIFYSNTMHHVFGWIVFALSITLLLDLLVPQTALRLRRIGPLLLLLGGIFLMIFSDQDAWPLYRVTPHLPIWDKEVFLHKTYSALLILVGAKGLWSQIRSRKHSDNGSEGLKVQSKTMAVFALVGGALLFTHVHSVAPYSNNAVGVYLHHTVMGFVALLIGTVKLLEDLKPSVILRIAYPLLMLTESLFLIRYNEGLPWFLGYDDRNMLAKHGGRVSRLGPYVAELAYDETNGTITTWIRSRDTGSPVSRTHNVIDLVIRQGDEATTISMQKQPNDPEGVYKANATFLLRQPLFSAQLNYLIADSTWTADFEPWIMSSAIAIPQRAFGCPMHSNIGSDQPGVCTECGMPLAPTRISRLPGASHDPDTIMKVSSEPVGRPDSRTYMFRAAVKLGGMAGNAPLSVIHTKKVHLIIVSQDLSYFDHVHPVEQPNAEFSLQYEFPSSGNYTMFWDCTPLNRANQVFREEFHVSGPAGHSQKLIPDLTTFKDFVGYQIGFRISPSPANSRDESVLEFEIRKDGRLVTDLEPFLGAGGHCVTLDERSRVYLHSHPVERSGDVTFGPVIRFHTRFPKPGLYKTWGQFSHHGKTLIAAFVFRVS